MLIYFERVPSAVFSLCHELTNNWVQASSEWVNQCFHSSHPQPSSNTVPWVLGKGVPRSRNTRADQSVCRKSSNSNFFLKENLLAAFTKEKQTIKITGLPLPSFLWTPEHGRVRWPNTSLPAEGLTSGFPSHPLLWACNLWVHQAFHCIGFKTWHFSLPNPFRAGAEAAT